MRYCGSKKRYAKEFVPILMAAAKNEQTTFIDMCCGGCSILSEIPLCNKIGVDSNEYVIELWKKLRDNVINGYPYDGIPYDITEEQYQSIKQSYLDNDGRHPKWLIGYVGNALSYGSAWFNGFAKPNYNKRNSKGEPENHCHESYNGLMKQLKEFKHFDNTKFVWASFEDYTVYGDNTVVYCDPPYFNTKKYMTDFDHNKFYDWCRRINATGVKVFVSEYEMPSDFKCIWQKEKKDGMGTTKSGGQQNSYVEKLFTILV